MAILEASALAESVARAGRRQPRRPAAAAGGHGRLGRARRPATDTIQVVRLGGAQAARVHPPDRPARANCRGASPRTRSGCSTSARNCAPRSTPTGPRAIFRKAQIDVAAAGAGPHSRDGALPGRRRRVRDRRQHDRPLPPATSGSARAVDAVAADDRAAGRRVLAHRARCSSAGRQGRPVRSAGSCSAWRSPCSPAGGGLSPTVPWPRWTPAPSRAAPRSRSRTRNCARGYRRRGHGGAGGGRERVGRRPVPAPAQPAGGRRHHRCTGRERRRSTGCAKPLDRSLWGNLVARRR